jgi:hypothetical protein
MLSSEERITGRETRCSDTLSTTNPTSAVLGSKAGIHHEGPALN